MNLAVLFLPYKQLFIRSSKIVGKTNSLIFNLEQGVFLKNCNPYKKNNLDSNSEIIDNNNQIIIKNKTKQIFLSKDKEFYLESNEFIRDKKLISISPGGIKGFYLLGILSYIKENYDLEDCIFSGASAGAWNALFMCYKKDPREFIFKNLNSDIIKNQNIYDIEYTMKYKLLETYKEEDFDLNRLFIGVTTIQKWSLITNIFSDFDDLEDAINCCIASSHIPLLTGGLTNRYYQKYTFDGGFTSYPYLNIKTPILHVSPNMFQENENNNSTRIFRGINNIHRLFNENKKNIPFIKLYDDGYQDAKINKNLLDKIFIDKWNTLISV
jgi:hypothetical protein